MGREEAQAEHVRPPGVWAGGGRGPAGGVRGRRGDRAAKPAKPGEGCEWGRRDWPAVSGPLCGSSVQPASVADASLGASQTTLVQRRGPKSDE